MADGDTPPVEVKEIHHGLTKAQLDEEMLKIKNHLEELHNSRTAEDKQEREELKAELKTLKDEAAARKKADEAAEAAKGGGSTMVQPPASMPPAQSAEPATQPASGDGSSGDGGPERKRRLRLW